MSRIIWVTLIEQPGATLGKQSPRFDFCPD
jgi:hypothetical protein